MPQILPIVDRIAGWLLIVGALLHGYGSYLAYPSLSANLVWALSGSVAALLLAAVNLLRVNRPNDYVLAWISFAGCLVWIGIVGAFAATLPNPIDPRPHVRPTTDFENGDEFMLGPVEGSHATIVLVPD